MHILINTQRLALSVLLLASLSACEATTSGTGSDATTTTTTGDTDTADTAKEEPKPFNGKWKLTTKLVKDCGNPCPKGGELPATLDAEISVYGVGAVSVKITGEGVSLSGNGMMPSETKLNAGFQGYLEEAGFVGDTPNKKWNLGTSIKLELEDGGKTAKGTMLRGLTPYDGSGKNFNYGREYDVTATLQ